MKPPTPEELRSRLSKLHSTLDFSACQPMRRSSVIAPICPIHGPVKMSVEWLLSPRCKGCSVCSRAESKHLAAKRSEISQAQFEANIKRHFGDKFDLTNVKYLGSRSKVTLTCPEHGEFSLPAGDISCGLRECPTCGKLRGSEALKNTVEDIRDRLFRVYGDEYDLDEVVYEGAHKVGLKCRHHGIFFKSLNSMLHGGGCRKCHHRDKYNNRILSHQATFVEKAQALHGGKYSYEKTVYTGSLNPVTVTCMVHGDFQVAAASHIKSSDPRGCKYCSGALTCQDDFAHRVAKASAGGVKVVGQVIDMRHKIKALCMNCNRVWKAWPRVLLDGHRCPKCFSTFNPEVPSTLYLMWFRLKDGCEIFKVGVTNKDVKNRLVSLGTRQQVVERRILAEVRYEKGIYAQEDERSIIEELASYRFMGEKFTGNGHSEMFVIDPRLVMRECPFTERNILKEPRVLNIRSATSTP